MNKLLIEWGQYYNLDDEISELKELIKFYTKVVEETNKESHEEHLNSLKTELNELEIKLKELKEKLNKEEL